MLKLSTKSSYGLRACLALAASDTRLSSTAVAASESIPQRYLEQILSVLRAGNIVDSTRGAKGGYSLSRPADEITISDLVECVEGTLPHLLCTNPELQADNCLTHSECQCRGLCHELDSSLKKVLKGTTLADILNQPKRLEQYTAGHADFQEPKLSKGTKFEKVPASTAIATKEV